MRGRERALEVFGLTGRRAKWIALASLHGDVFTRSQLSAWLGVSRFKALWLVQALAERKPATEETVGGLKFLPDQQVFDVFISHTSEDKAEVVRPLATALRDAGLSVWYEQCELRMGDSLRGKLGRELANSCFGVVVLSRAVVGRGWPEYELDGLVTRAVSGEQVLLPIWNDVTKREVHGLLVVPGRPCGAQHRDAYGGRDCLRDYPRDPQPARWLEAVAGTMEGLMLSILGRRKRYLETPGIPAIRFEIPRYLGLIEPDPYHRREWRIIPSQFDFRDTSS